MVSVYFHLPFCKKKCPYCHFFVLRENEQQKEQLQEALLRHLAQLKPHLEGRSIPSVYFGGGTPSLYGPRRIAQLLDALSLPASCEVTLEANPEEITPELISAYRQAGINRLSIGVQSLDDALLHTLGRSHSAEKACRAIESAYEVGLTNLSIDLMYELPGQTLASFQNTLNRAVSLPITHLSLYNLTIEPGTPFDRKRSQLEPRLPSSEENLALLQMAVATLTTSGMERYEISAFARPGYTSCHNMGYWTARPFWGLGPSAFSYIEGKRFRNHCNLAAYIKTLGTDFEELLSYPANLCELLAVELRLLRGVSLTAFQQRHGPLPSSTLKQIDLLVEQDLLKRCEDQVSLSPKGLLFYDSVASEIIA